MIFVSDRTLVLLFLFAGVFAYSQTWTQYVDSDWDIEFTVITMEQFNRIVNAQETTANFVILEFWDEIQRQHSRVTSGSRPNFSGFYYLYIRWIPKTASARIHSENVRAMVRYGNTSVLSETKIMI